LYSLGGYSYDGAYAQLMHSGLIGSNNWVLISITDGRSRRDITDVPRISNRQTCLQMEFLQDLLLKQIIYH
jgi:hypothetical protein